METLYCTVYTVLYILYCIPLYKLYIVQVLKVISDNKNIFAREVEWKVALYHRIIDDRMEKYVSLFVFISKYSSIAVPH